MKKCTECRSPVKKRIRESFRYTACGLENVVLFNVPAYVCTNCGEEFTGIPSMQKLHDILAKVIVEKTSSITAQEVKYLRTWLDCSNKEFAAFMGVSEGQASRWASGEKPISATAGHLLRTIVALKGSIGFEVATLAKIDRNEESSSPYSIKRTGSGWGQSVVPTA